MLRLFKSSLLFKSSSVIWLVVVNTKLPMLFTTDSTALNETHVVNGCSSQSGPADQWTEFSKHFNQSQFWAILLGFFWTFESDLKGFSDYLIFGAISPRFFLLRFLGDFSRLCGDSRGLFTDSSRLFPSLLSHHQSNPFETITQLLAHKNVLQTAHKRYLWPTSRTWYLH